MTQPASKTARLTDIGATMNATQYNAGRAVTVLLTTLLSVTTILLGAPARAQEAPSGVMSPAGDVPQAREETLETPRTIAMGTGGRATAIGTAALAQNPANMALARLYHIHAGLQYIGGSSALAVNSAIVDSVSNRVAAGMSFRGVFGSGRDYSGWDARLALAMALAPQISLGVGARYLRLPARRNDDNGAAIGNHARGFTLDASVTLAPIEWLRISAMAQNMIAIDSALTPRVFGGSAGVMVPTVGLSIAGDVMVDTSTFSGAEIIAGMGAEYVVANVVPLRLGYSRDRGRDLHTLSLGIGYVDQQMAVEFGLRTDVAGRGRRTELNIGFRYNVQ